MRLKTCARFPHTQPFASVYHRYSEKSIILPKNIDKQGEQMYNFPKINSEYFAHNKRMKNTNKVGRRKERSTAYFMVFHSVILIFALLFLAFRVFGVGKRVLEAHISVPVRSFSAFVFSSHPIPVFELLIAFSPMLIPLILWYTVSAFPRRSSFAIPLLLVEILVITYAASFQNFGIYEEKDLHGVGDNLKSTYIKAFDRIVTELNEIAGKIEFVPEREKAYEAASVAAFVTAEDRLGWRGGTPTVKNSLFSDALTKAKILGYYSFPTAEIYINSEQPEYMAVFTAAHEQMHFFGVAREDEANFYAFLSLYSSTDPFLSYSAVLRAYEYLASDMYYISRSDFQRINSRLPSVARCDLLSSRKYADRASPGFFGKISDSLNDAAIGLRDDRGAHSYSETGRLLTLFFSGYIS